MYFPCSAYRSLLYYTKSIITFRGLFGRNFLMPSYFCRVFFFPIAFLFTYFYYVEGNKFPLDSRMIGCSAMFPVMTNSNCIFPLIIFQYFYILIVYCIMFSIYALFPISLPVVGEGQNLIRLM